MPKGNPNPSPSTRFGAENGNPQSPGGWSKEHTISYQYKRFLAMSPEKLEEWAKNTPKSERTVAMDIAYNRILEGRKSLPDVKEITDRTEGKAPQNIKLGGDGTQIPITLVEFVDGTTQSQDTDTE